MLIDDNCSGIGALKESGLIITRLEQTVGFINQLMSEAPRLREFFGGARRRRPCPFQR